MKTYTTHSISRRAALRGGMALAALPTMAAALSACSPQARQEISPYSDVIANLSDRIIPETDTPGAVTAGVPGYVEAVVASFLSDAERADFVAGLEALDGLAHAQGATSFVTADAEIQANILQTLDDRVDVEELEIARMSALATWRSLRRMVIFGYYTSETATQELAYEEIPGRYVGCIPFDQVGRAWLDRGV